MNAHQYRARPLDPECNRLFVASLKTRTKSEAADAGSNIYVEAFLFVATMVLTHYRTFTLNDFFNLSHVKEVPPLETKKLFTLWTDKMLSLGRITKVQGVYDEDVFAVV